MAHDGTALGALNEIIESAGGTSDAATLVPAIEELGEVIGSGGGGGGTIADGSITTAKLADKAVTWEKIDPNAVAIIRSVWLVAADSQTDQVLTQLGYEHGTLTPKQMATEEQYANGTLRLCWISGTTLEVAPITFIGNLQTQVITLYARGFTSTASGFLGVDESWTITANA